MKITLISDCILHQYNYLDVYENYLPIVIYWATVSFHLELMSSGV